MDRYFYFDDIFEDYTKYSLKISKSLYLKSGLYPIIDQGKEEIAGYSNKNINIFDKIPVIIFGDHTRIFKYVDYPFFLGADGVKILKNTSNLFLDKYLYYSLKNFKIPNTGYNRHFKWLKDFKIKYISLAKQKRITSLIEKIEFFILKKEKQLEYLKELKKSLFTKYSKNKKVVNLELEEICEFIKDGTHQTPTYVNINENGYKFLSSKDVSKGIINWDNTKYISEELHKELYKKIAPRKNDILLAKNGTTGVAALVDKEEIFDIYVSLAILRLKKEYNPKYILEGINSIETNQQFKRSLKGIGVPNLHLKEIKKVKIPIPPIELQNKFAQRVEKIEKLSFNFY
ncbi:restriction endonuclease subunit S [Fusobacterium hwasookii]|uniref:Restriction modification system DNA specificity subunit n=1 Tax=Fusobacterium hwasookii ChDC F128 TaxID=1216362 RepID=A0ABN0H334_9FUSO|nr:restriction endonuclease subunit S [Fusobacterium hwasookii]EJU08711.1 restriction modification system DNA specificity subunit [Fusobacterium hwasookii ChDC F128]